MIYKLSLNASKGRWEKLSISETQAKLSLELAELNEAIEHKNTVEILLEAADVANFALIVANIQLDGQHDRA
jgi:NTP pyrophosphatase (non-canonical NTP hydrolase)